MKSHASLQDMVTRIFDEGEPLDARGVYELVEGFFPDESACTLPMVEEQLERLREDGFLVAEGGMESNKTNATTVYRISEYGFNAIFHKKDNTEQ